MTKDEALKLALEALENHCGNYKLDDEGVKRFVAACKAIKEALAQDELCSSQEPDAFDDDIEVLGHNEIRTRYRLEKGTKLYTTPPKRPWVGLTDEKIAEVAERMEASDPTDSFWREFARAIEAAHNIGVNT